jgi:hypothetical protein
MLHRHCRALDVPARASLPPRAVPGRLSRLLRLPEVEVEGVLLGLAREHPRPGNEVRDGVPGQLSVPRELPHAVIDVPPGGIGQPLLNKAGDEVDYLGYVLRGPRLDVGGQEVEPPEKLPEHGLVFAHHFRHRYLKLVGLVDELVLDVGEVLDVDDTGAPERQPALQDVHGDPRAGVPDMRLAGRRWPALVKAHLPVRIHRDEPFFRPRQGVIQPHLRAFLL